MRRSTRVPRRRMFPLSLLIGDRQTVPVTVCLADVPRMTRVGLDLMTKPEDEAVDRSRERCIRITPHEPQQLVARHDAASPLGEVAEDLEFPIGHRNLPVVPG